MLKAIITTKKPLFWILMHIILGIACAFVKPIFMLWFVAALLSSLNLISRGTNAQKMIGLLSLVTYFSSLELLARMSKAYQYKLPWEFGKYVVFFGAIYGILVLNSRKGLQGFALFVLLIPAMFFGSAGRDILWHDIVFNLLGPISIAFSVIAFSKLKISRQLFRQILKLVLYPAISVLAYVFIKTPDFDKINFELGANFATTGGYGSNQVSTILGMGLYITFLFWVNKWELTGNRLADLGLMLLFAFQGLLSFSRGGMIGGGIGILFFIFFITRASAKQKKKYTLPVIGKYVFPAILSLVVIFQVADSVTNGLLTLRYQGENNATLAGKREVDLNTLTTGRFEIFVEDMAVWQDNFVFGSGAGVSQYLRSEQHGLLKPIASHVELSRLLADHGLLGLTWFLILVYLAIKLVKFRNNPKYQGILAGLFAVAVYTTFHAATRTYLTPLFIGIALTNIVDINEPEQDKKRKVQPKPMHQPKQLATV